MCSFWGQAEEAAATPGEPFSQPWQKHARPLRPKLGMDTLSLPPVTKCRHMAKPKVKDQEHKPCLPLEWEEQQRCTAEGVDTGRREELGPVMYLPE